MEVIEQIGCIILAFCILMLMHITSNGVLRRGLKSYMDLSTRGGNKKPMHSTGLFTSKF
jgi:hypothetical protein